MVNSPDSIRWALVGGAGAVLALSWMETVSHGSRHVELAVHDMVKGKHAGLFWSGLVFGAVAPIVLSIVAIIIGGSVNGAVAIGIIAGVFALVGMFLSETAFVRAGQSVPLS